MASSSPGPLSADESRFSMRVAYGEEALPATSVFMNAIELSAQYAELDFKSRIRQRQGVILTEFPQVEIAVLPKPPAKLVDVRLIIWTIYGGVLDMVIRNRFKENEIEVLWDTAVVAWVYFTLPLDIARSTGTNASITVPPFLENVPQSSSSTPNSLEASTGRFDWNPLFTAHGKIMPPQDIFLLALGTIKALAPTPMTQKVAGPFHVSSEIVDANLQAYLRDRRVPRSSPPFYQYAHVLEAVRRMPGWMLGKHKFAEFFASVEVSSKIVGMILVEKGKFTPGAASENLTTS
ncbi:MAG: hypothetical protein Q9170_002810 [Blastenia crenularia]